jgi:hypothetical protein
MAEDLGTIDVSHLDALSKLEADQRVIRALAEKAAWHRDKVVEVYSRVVRDYEARIRALDEQAETVRRRVRDDLKTLDGLHDRCREAVDQARIELQESEFRHEIGEFTRDEFQKRQQAIECTIAERQEAFESVRTLRERYLDLLPAKAASTPDGASWAPAALPAAAPTSSPAAPTPALAPAEPSPVAAVAPAPPVRAPEPPPPPSLPSDSVPAAPAVGQVEAPRPPTESATCLVPPPSTTEFRVPPVPAGAESEQFGTVAVSSALLIEDKEGLPGAAHRLGLRTSLGRTPDNQIVVPSREVSRRHAEIVLGDGGYIVRDLGSPNGTFVNGERITEHRLQDGDRIGMGGHMFVFRAQ